MSAAREEGDHDDFTDRRVRDDLEVAATLNTFTQSQLTAKPQIISVIHTQIIVFTVRPEAIPTVVVYTNKWNQIEIFS